MKGLFKFFLLFLTVSSVFGAPNFNSGAEFTIEEPIEITDGYKIKASIKFRSNEKICTVLNAYFG
ncbi:MAG: hypothetical protein VX341_09285, partial [Bdellovibrionota bacterium]|nr:hypothetical protein [Bdellovibrionota bacterium]